MGHHHEGDATGIEFLEKGDHLVARAAIEVTGRFVSQQNLWIIRPFAKTLPNTTKMKLNICPCDWICVLNYCISNYRFIGFLSWN